MPLAEASPSPEPLPSDFDEVALRKADRTGKFEACRNRRRFNQHRAHKDQTIAGTRCDGKRPPRRESQTPSLPPPDPRGYPSRPPAIRVSPLVSSDRRPRRYTLLGGGIQPIPIPKASTKARRGRHPKSNRTTSESWFLNPPDPARRIQRQPLPREFLAENSWQSGPESYARAQSIPP